MLIPRIPLALACVLSASCLSHAEEPQGPFPPDQWPASADPEATVHYVSVADAFQELGAGWTTGNMNILPGGPGSDQTTEPITIGGFQGVKVTGDFLNVADLDFPEWADDEEIDILMQVYGDGALFTPDGEVRNFNFLIGTLPDLDFPVGGQIALEARNQQWNWVLFRIPNSIREEGDGTRRVGSIPVGAQGDTAAGGVNGGTIRMEQVPNLIVRVVAFGEVGAFGEPEQVNQFVEGEECAPLPETNLAWIDFANDQSANMEVLNDKDQTVEIYEAVGPADDLRRAVMSWGTYMNFGITDNYLGLPCNEPQTVKICVEYYDDPGLFGYSFGPEAYATDAQGGIGFVAQDQRVTLQGSGEWQQHSWIVSGVNLFGVNTAPLTAGPRLYFDYPIFISKYSLAILRTGDHPLAGQDPLADCISDPNFCGGVYGNYAEFDLSTGLLDGLAPGTSTGDQEMIQEEAGPAGDRRMAVRPAFDDAVNTNFTHEYLNFSITDEKLGPSSQPGLLLAICVTYYDDPALAGESFRPNVYQSDEGGSIGLEFPPAEMAVTLEGTDTWRKAYFELPNMKFLGVNEGPQAAARFSLTDKIFFTSVRYGAIRPCGPDANVNPLEDCKPIIVNALKNTDGTVRIAWPMTADGFVIEESSDVSPAVWTPVAATPETENGEIVLTVTPEGRKFYRLSNSPVE